MELVRLLGRAAFEREQTERELWLAESRMNADLTGSDLWAVRSCCFARQQAKPGSARPPAAKGHDALWTPHFAHAGYAGGIYKKESCLAGAALR